MDKIKASLYKRIVHLGKQYEEGRIYMNDEFLAATEDFLDDRIYFNRKIELDYIFRNVGKKVLKDEDAFELLEDTRQFFMYHFDGKSRTKEISIDDYCCFIDEGGFDEYLNLRLPVILNKQVKARLRNQLN